jgi:hypothetical protein
VTVVAQQQAVHTQLRAQLSVLLADHQALRERVAKESHTSHKPPTSDA